MKRAITLALVPAVLSLAVGQAAADTIERGHILHVEDREIYFDIGAARGIVAGQRLRIKRPIQLKHPVTGKMVSDWLPVGAAQVTAAGNALGMARLEPELLALIAMGDIVEVFIESPDAGVGEANSAVGNAMPASGEPIPSPGTADTAPGTTPVHTAAKPEPAVAPETAPETAMALEARAVLAVWRTAAGQPVEAQIAAWEQYLAAHASSPYAAAVREDLDILRAHRDRLRPPELSLEDRELGGLEHEAPTRATAGEPIALAFLLDRPEQLAAAWLHYRPRSTSSYRKAVLQRDGDAYLRGQIPASEVHAPGVEYFVEIATQRGDVGTGLGRPDQPLAVAVAEPSLTALFAEQRNRSRITVSTTYLDFATFDGRSGDRTDTVFLFEADFLYRLRGPVHGIRTGMGVLRGKGGYSNAVYDDGQVPEAGFHYGYTELELRSSRRTAVLARLVAGVGRGGFGLGFEGRFRLGPEDGTNLSVGASQITDIGFLSDVRMQWSAVDKVPLGLAVAVTDQPNEGNLGVRLTTDIGYRVLPWLQPTVRISYQARTVVHSGVGAGLGLVFDW